MYATTVMVIVAMATAESWGGEQVSFSHKWGKEVSPCGGGHSPRESEEDARLTRGLWAFGRRIGTEHPTSPKHKDEIEVRPLLTEEAANLATTNEYAQLGGIHLMSEGGGPHGAWDVETANALGHGG